MVDLAAPKRTIIDWLKRNRRRGLFQGGFGRMAMWMSDRRRGVLAGAFFAAVAVLLLGYALASPRFLISEVRINRCRHLETKQVLEMFGFRSDQNIFRLNLGKICARLEQHPWVAGVRAHRILPDVLVVTIEERVPYALVSLPDLYYMDSKGVVFKKLEPADPRNFSVVTGLTGKDIVESSGADRLLAGAVNVIRMAEASEVPGLKELSEVSVDKSAGYTVFPLEGQPGIVLGTGDFDKKLVRLARLRDFMGERMNHVARIDLDVPDRAVLAPSRKSGGVL